MPTRNVNLTDELDRFVAKKVKTGRYENASEVVRAGLRTLEREEQHYEAKISLPGRCHGQGADSRRPPSVSDFVLDASLALQWFLEDEEIENTAWPSLLAPPKNAPWSRLPARTQILIETGWKSSNSATSLMLSKPVRARNF